MADPFVGEIRMFAGNFAPRGWAFCDGQLLSVSSNDALFAVLGTTYGGDGRTTFALPELRGRVPIHAGSGPGLSSRTIGARSGAENVTLTVAQLPSHTHALRASTDFAGDTSPAGNVTATSTGASLYSDDNPAMETPVPLHTSAISQTGGGSQHGNIMPFQCVNFIVALFGVFPSRN